MCKTYEIIMIINLRMVRFVLALTNDFSLETIQLLFQILVIIFIAERAKIFTSQWWNSFLEIWLMRRVNQTDMEKMSKRTCEIAWCYWIKSISKQRVSLHSFLVVMENFLLLFSYAKIYTYIKNQTSCFYTVLTDFFSIVTLESFGFMKLRKFPFL